MNIRHLIATGLIASALNGYAEDYYITVKQQNGTEYSIPLVGMSMTFTDGQLKAQTATESIALDLTTLSHMFFAPAPTGIDNITLPHDISRAVYDLQGRRINNMEGGPKGIYIIKEGDDARKEVKQ